MTSQEFAEVYEKYKDDAIRVAMSTPWCSRAMAEDALQNVTIYMLGQLHRYNKITKAYFIRAVKDRAKDVKKSEVKRILNRERSVGDPKRVAELEQEYELHNRTGVKDGTSEEAPRDLAIRAPDYDDEKALIEELMEMS